MGPHQLIGQILLGHPVPGKAVGIFIPLAALLAGGVGMDILQLPGDAPVRPARTSARAASMAAQAVLDLGAVAKRITASAKGSLASGSPSWRALSTQAFTMGTAMG